MQTPVPTAFQIQIVHISNLWYSDTTVCWSHTYVYQRKPNTISSEKSFLALCSIALWMFEWLMLEPPVLCGQRRFSSNQLEGGSSLQMNTSAQRHSTVKWTQVHTDTDKCTHAKKRQTKLVLSQEGARAHTAISFNLDLIDLKVWRETGSFIIQWQQSSELGWLRKRM